MKKETKRRATVKIQGTKKRCRKTSSEYLDCLGENDQEAITKLKEKVINRTKNYKIVNGFSKVQCQDITIIDHGDYTTTQYDIFCKTSKTYDFYL